MGIYIYKEKSGYGLVFIEANSKPEMERKFTTINGKNVPQDRQDYMLIDTILNVENNIEWSNKNQAATKDAMETILIDLGGTIELGFNMLAEDEKVIAAINDVGTPQQIAAYLPNENPDAYTLDIVT